ncbi:STAS domain-containing protein [Acidocella aminolytica]|jgi:ABC-type transporter Mla MlaB component|uniref:Sulfate transporter/antisigma-factor antagonist STAS n=1 Tax=Acidocella aminolytica 101 = DSM 11237 TaxID=1120923 RepID=A0A0D6PBD6_9PROT|nr:STAS domain-containing protein [Acidocella aminolytica]GAN79085.1 sulfate transporter/antisigma-factor antagonist STAS [Acidocella aminolytica 101 = DSM 11237]GBQ40021.1 sulfate transporter/antisigma-factor antagonist sTAs [Acidocella aminolytica 101 = DSM 11237]SHF14513.1 STAS domain-containing protein [Acidocella aminolytica 101 = DSM 11237]
MVDDMLSVLKLSGVIDIRSIGDSFEKVKNAVGGGASVEIDLTDITDIDLTFVQLIESARRSAALSGTTIRLSEPAGGVVLETLNRGGFLNDPSDERTLFWLGRTEPM